MAPTYFCRFPGSKIPTAIAAPRFPPEFRVPGVSQHEVLLCRPGALAADKAGSRLAVRRLRRVRDKRLAMPEIENVVADKATLRSQSFARRDAMPADARGFDQFHFYTLNQANLSYAACRLLGLRPKDIA